MRRFFLGAAAALAVLAQSCTKNKEFKTDFYEKEVKEAVAEGAKDSIDISVSLEYPVSGASKAVLETITKTIIGKSLDSDTEDMKDAVDRYIKTTADNYRETNASLYKEFEDSDEYKGSPALSWTDDLNGFFSGRHEDIVSYTLTAYSYTGGAHGITGYYCMNMSLKDGSTVTEKDLFTDGYEDTLNELLTSHLHDAVPEQDQYESLFVKDIEANGNFRVTEEGVTYVYDPYELGPYYLGAIEVSVPWSEMEGILKQ